MYGAKVSTSLPGGVGVQHRYSGTDFFANGAECFDSIVQALNFIGCDAIPECAIRCALHCVFQRGIISRFTHNRGGSPACSAAVTDCGRNTNGVAVAVGGEVEFAIKMNHDLLLSIKV